MKRPSAFLPRCPVKWLGDTFIGLKERLRLAIGGGRENRPHAWMQAVRAARYKLAEGLA